MVQGILKAQKEIPDHVVLTASVLDEQGVSIVFKSRHDLPKKLRFMKLYRDSARSKVLNFRE